MELYYSPELMACTEFSLPDEEAQHAFRTRRLQVGGRIDVTNGAGLRLEAEIMNNQPKSNRLKTLRSIQLEKAFPEIHVWVAPLKQEARFEWIIEKAVELGVSEIHPILTKRTEKIHLRINRLERIAIAAMKQSLKFYLPRIVEPVSFDKLWPLKGKVLFAHCMEGVKEAIRPELCDAEVYHVFIGPEGDFHPDELKEAQKYGVTEISLGNSRLRTETAAITALVQLHHSISIK